MTDVIGTYSFFPFLRQGIANNIETQDLDSSVKVRAAVNIALTLKGEGVDGTEIEPISKDVALYGPGDVIGIKSKAIIKTEPSNSITNFEPNYLPYIDFYDEDFPWRYTPTAPNTVLGRLPPWIMLVVLKEDEFTDGKNISNKPLPYIDVPHASDVFPPSDQLWAWAHVHVNEDIVKLDVGIKSNDLNSVLRRFREVLNRNPDLAYSRIMCPRKLDANTPYHAFLIPVFESGRLAGLGLDPVEKFDAVANLHATYSAWETYTDRPELESYPYYYRWSFRTSTVGDFEYLVGLLECKLVDSRVGRRYMDVHEPVWNISGITDENLGDHDNREEQGESEEEAVLVIRGELLKEYPTAVIYAHKAEWRRKEDGTIDNTKERQLVELHEEELKNPPRHKVRIPRYGAMVKPDIYFFGFDLTIEEAKGGTGDNPDDEPGWFFVIKQRPGQPRFGLDIEREGDISDINVWNDLAWEDVVPGVTAGDFININEDTQTIKLSNPHSPTDESQEKTDELQEKYEQYDNEDMHLTWNKDMNAAEIAYILYQVPVLVTYHASEMLRGKYIKKV